jgi:hypothetical protein
MRELDALKSSYVAKDCIGLKHLSCISQKTKFAKVTRNGYTGYNKTKKLNNQSEW